MILALFLHKNSRRTFYKVGSAELEHKFTSVDLEFTQSFTVQKVEGGILFEIVSDALLELQ